MADKPSFYVTTAISYPNGAPHIGHAYEAIATDAIARFKRLDGYDVFFLTGVDEHGLKMTQTAATAGITPRELANKNAPLFQAMCDLLNVSYDRFIRTTEPAHYDASQAIWNAMEQSGRYLYRHLRRMVLRARRSILRGIRDRRWRRQNSTRPAGDAGGVD